LQDAAEIWPDLAGRLTPVGHVLPVRVYYEDTDFSGVVYHASYLRFMERGRSDFMRCLGLDYRALEAGGDGPVAFAVRRMTIDWLRPARMDDLLEVTTRPVELRGASLDLEQAIVRGREVLVRALVKVALVDGQGRARRMPEGLRSALSARNVPA